jgi:HK97 gp10 family phage protein
MDISFSIEGLDKIDQASDRIRRAVDDEVAKGLYAGAQQIATDYRKSVLAGGKSGRLYRRRSIVHRASAPGEAPASDTGRLVNAIHVELESGLSAIMRVATKYAELLEFGTSKMAARPAALPAAEKNRAWIINRLAQAVQNAIGK